MKKQYGQRRERLTDKELLSVAQDLKVKMDSWQNLTTGLGDVLKDRRLVTRPAAPIDLVKEELEYLFAADPLAKRICSAPPRAAFRPWLRVTSGEIEELPDLCQDRFDELGIVSQVIEAKTFARLHGGAVLLLGAEDGQTADQPLNEDSISSFTWVNMYNRWEIIPASYYNDPSKAKFGTPATYRIQAVESPVGVTKATGKVIHESRLLRFEGTLTTRARQAANSGWSDSVFVSLFPVLRAYGHAMTGAESIMTEFTQAVYKYKDLAGAISSGGAELIRARAQVINTMRSLLGAMIIDSEGEDFTRQGAPVTGMADLWDRFERMISAATGMPSTVLFGRSAAGMSATGEGDERAWLNTLAEDRNLEDARQIEKLIRIMLKAKDGPTGGIEPESWRIVWAPLWQMSRNEELDCKLKQANIDQIEISQQMVDPDEAAMSRHGGTEYSYETRLDMDARDGKEPAKSALTGLVGGITEYTDILSKYAANELSANAAAEALRVFFGMSEADIAKALADKPTPVTP